MASTILGRAACPECGFPHAHIKQKQGDGTRAYRYCPECGSQYYARSQAQHDALVGKMVHPPVVVEQPAAAPATEPAAPPEPPAAPPEPVNYRVVLGVKVPV